MGNINKIKELTENKIWLAPLAGVTDKSFRTICKECGADVVVSEMVSADGLIYDKERSIRYAEFIEEQRPFGIQLFGSDPDIMAKGTEIILERKPDFIDINMGCPVKKVVKRGAGSALMKSPDVAAKIVTEVKAALAGLNIPVSVKFRSGWDFLNINAVDFGKRMEDAGADIITLHPRTRSQMYAGTSNWELIKQLKDNVSVPVVGNGDIWTVHDAKAMLTQTGCDSIMLARGIIGHPWLIKEIKNYLATGEIYAININEKIEIIKRHFELTLEDKGNETALKEMRTHFSSYTKGFRGGAKVRNFINRSTDKAEIINAIEKLYLEQEYEEN